MSNTSRATALLLLLGLACNRTGSAPDADLASAAEFVRDFYVWYVPATKAGTGSQRAIVDSAALFTPALVQALEADGEAQAKNPNDVVGLDGDPFLDAQDFCTAYEVGTARREGARMLVDVRGNCEGRTDSTPDVVAVLSREARGWVFTNFRYPRRNSDLLRDLAELKRERDSTPPN